jgi:hypothetical protein
MNTEYIIKNLEAELNTIESEIKLLFSLKKEISLEIMSRRRMIMYLLIEEQSKLIKELQSNNFKKVG